jgi:hypothetical protein
MTVRVCRSSEEKCHKSESVRLDDHLRINLWCSCHAAYDEGNPLMRLWLPASAIGSALLFQFMQTNDVSPVLYRTRPENGTSSAPDPRPPFDRLNRAVVIDPHDRTDSLSLPFHRLVSGVMATQHLCSQLFITLHANKKRYILMLKCFERAFGVVWQRSKALQRV